VRGKGTITPQWIQVLADIIEKGKKAEPKPETGPGGAGSGAAGNVFNINVAGGAGGSATGGTSTSTGGTTTATGGTSTADVRAAAAASAGGGKTTSATKSTETTPTEPKKVRTGGRVAGAPLSSTPDAIRKREARARKRTGGSAATATAESIDFDSNALLEKLMSLDLEEQSSMDAAQAEIAAQPTTWQKIKQKTTTGSNALGAAASTAGSTMKTAAKIIDQSSGAPSLRSFASAADVSTQAKDVTGTGSAAPAAAQPAASTGAAAGGTALNVPAQGSSPARRYTLKGNTYVTDDGKPVAADLNQLLHAISYGKVKRS
jgi:hypothetical protein